MIKSIDEEKWLAKWYASRPAKANKICQIIQLFSANKSHEPLIAEIGCYEGSMTPHFAKHTQNFLIGIDVSWCSLQIAKKKVEHNNKNVELVVADAKFLPIRNRQVNWLICNHVIDYIDDKIAVIKEFQRILATDGIIYLSVISRFFLKMYRLFPFIFVRFFGPFYGRLSPSTHTSFGDPMNYNFWKKEIIRRTNITVFDVTPFLIINSLKNSPSNQVPMKNNSIKEFFTSLFSHFLGSWVFILCNKIDNELSK